MPSHAAPAPLPYFNMHLQCITHNSFKSTRPAYTFTPCNISTLALLHHIACSWDVHAMLSQLCPDVAPHAAQQTVLEIHAGMHPMRRAAEAMQYHGAGAGIVSMCPSIPFAPTPCTPCTPRTPCRAAEAMQDQRHGAALGAAGGRLPQVQAPAGPCALHADVEQEGPRPLHAFPAGQHTAWLQAHHHRCVGDELRLR